MEPDKVAWLSYQLCHQDSDFLDHLTNLVIEFIPKHILDPCVPEEFKNPKERMSKERHKPMTEQVADKKRQEEHMLEVKKIVSELLEVSDLQEITRAGLEDFCKSIAEAAQLRISQSVKRSRSAMWNWISRSQTWKEIKRMISSDTTLIQEHLSMLICMVCACLNPTVCRITKSMEKQWINPN